MVKRKWEIITSMGYVGTDTTEEIDLIDDGLYTEEELDSLSDEDVMDQLYDDAFECAKEKIDICVKASDG